MSELAQFGILGVPMRARNEGAAAFYAGKLFEDNPYMPTQIERTDWSLGYIVAEGLSGNQSHGPFVPMT